MPLLLLFISAFMLSGLLFHRLKLDNETASRGLTFATSTAALGMLCFAIGIVSINACIVFLLAVIAVTAVISQKFKAPEKAQSVPAPSAETLFLFMLCVFPFLFVYIAMLVPVVQNWEMNNILTLIDAYSAKRQFYFDPLTPTSGATHLGYILFTMNDFWFPAGFPSMIFAALCLPILNAIAVNFVERSTALLATAAFACSPLFLTFATQPNFDSLFCYLTLGAFCASLEYLKTNKWAYLLFAGLLGGASCSVYHMGFLIVLLCATTIALRTRNPKASIFIIVTSLLVVAPILLRSYYFTGNPVFPYFQSYFASSDIAAVSTPYFRLNPFWREGLLTFLSQILRFPWEMTMQVQNFNSWSGNPSIYLMAFTLPGIALGTTKLRMLALFSLIGAALFFIFTDSIFALTPFIALLFIVATGSLENFPFPAQKIMPFVALGLILSGLFMQFATLYPNRDVILRRITRDEFLTQKIPHYSAYQLLDERYNDGGKVLLLEPRTGYVDIPALYNPKLLDKIANTNEAEQRAWLINNGIRYLLIPDSALKQNKLMSLKAKEMIEAWTLDRSLCQLTETIEHPALNGKGVDRVRIYTLNE